MGHWAEIGCKDTLTRFLKRITRIPEDVLRQEKALDRFSVAERMSWAAGRQTTREEDITYCLMGLFDVNMPLLYGEGSKAFIRLQEEIVRETRDDSLFAWCSTEASAARAPYRGLFASSPEEFAGSFDIKFDPIDGAEGTTSMMGNGRVSLSCMVRPVGDGRVILSLNCYCGMPFIMQGIYGVPTGNNTYLRSTPSELAYGITGAVGNITIEKHVLRTEADTADNKVGRDDEIHLGSLPPGCQLKKIHCKSVDGSIDSLTRVVPVRKVIGGKMAFEIETKAGQVTNIQQLIGRLSSRFLLIFWIERIPGSSLCMFHLDVKKVKLGGAHACFREANKPPRFLRRHWLDFDDYVLCVTTFQWMEKRHMVIEREVII